MIYNMFSTFATVTFTGERIKFLLTFIQPSFNLSSVLHCPLCEQSIQESKLKPEIMLFLKF